MGLSGVLAPSLLEPPGLLEEVQDLGWYVLLFLLLSLALASLGADDLRGVFGVLGLLGLGGLLEYRGTGVLGYRPADGYRSIGFRCTLRTLIL